MSTARWFKQRLPPRRGFGSSPDEAPLSAELLSIAQLERHAQALAVAHGVGTTTASFSMRKEVLLARLGDNERVLDDAYTLVSEAVARGRRITPAAEWLVDNYHLIEEQIRMARRHLPPGYSRELPRPTSGTAAGVPRVYDLALQLISHGHGRVDLDALRAFIVAYQSVQPLLLGELWAIPIMLRLSLIENLRRVVTAVATGRRDRERAGLWAERLLEVATTNPARVVLVLGDLIRDDPPLTDAFVTELATRVQGQGPALVIPMAWLEQRLAERGHTIEHAHHNAAQSQAADQVSIGNCIASMRFLGATDWRDFVESMSVVERVLREDPAGVYAMMDFASRDRYRHVVEAIARRSRCTQEEVARRAIALAGALPDPPAEADAPDAVSARDDPRTRHVGWFLVAEGRRTLERAVAMRRNVGQWLRDLAARARLPLYLATIVLLTVGMLSGLVQLAPHVAPDLADTSAPARVVFWSLAGFALLHLAISIVQWIVTLAIAPRVLPRLDFRSGVPPNHATAVAVPTMLTSPEHIALELEQLEVRYLANRDPHIWFGLLTDFRDGPAEHMPGDDALVAAARDGIGALNTKYGSGPDAGPFFLGHRARRWNPREHAWMGWERKRGKLEDFNALVRGQTGRFALTVGPIAELQAIAYVIALDADTELPRDTARQLIGSIAHPLNHPSWDAHDPCVRRGYTILQPRVGVTMQGASRSRYARLFAGEPGIDPYTRAVSDVYQDAFGEGSFVGKGIYAVDAMRHACGERFPDDRILSHDLLESAYGRSGLVSDVVLFEDYPATHAADVTRRARWIRGDWQIARWLLPSVPDAIGRSSPNPISALSKLKVLDNIRRSLVPIVLFALIVAGWLIPDAIAFTLALVMAVLFLPGVLVAIGAASRERGDVPLGQYLREIGGALGRNVLRETLTLAWLPFDAFINVVAIGKTLVRLLVTKKHLLEWRTAADSARSARTSLPGCYASMWMPPLTAVVLTTVLAIALATTGSPALFMAAPLLVLWLAAPLLAWWLSTPLRIETPRLTPADLTFLHQVARRTWHFFETTISATDSDLPPDNLQVDPPVGLAHRTSPTNIGLALLSGLGAYDLGYLGADTLVARTTRTFASLDRLPRYRGHFYNWYDTLTLAPLRPMYVSTVDSGNLTASLITLASGLEEITADPIVHPALWQGLRDTLDALDATQPPPTDVQPERRAHLDRLRTRLAAEPRGLTAHAHALAAAAAATAALVPSKASVALTTRIGQAEADLRALAPWLDLAPPGVAPDPHTLTLLAALDEVRSLAAIAQLETTLAPLVAAAAAPPDEPAQVWLAAIRAAIAVAADNASQRLAELRALAQRSLELGDTDLEFLYDRERHLLAIGYNAVDHRRDAGFYDLLASEARLISYVAISQGKLPEEHWFHLGRQLTSTGGATTLLSWSGSMFEYLMPLLVMPSYPGTLLDTTCRAAVARQIAYGRERHVPWGISESGYNTTDAHLNYQYRAFGVPGLGLKRGLGDDLVVAPYASAMGLMLAPETATANLRRLAAEDRLGPLGFFEAIDYTTSRLPPGHEAVVVCSYMAHHQGMAFLSLVHLLADRPMQRRFAADPMLRASDLLLQERVPRLTPISQRRQDVAATRISEPEPDLRIIGTPETPIPEVNLLSNGRYHLAVTQAGGGYSRWGDLAVTRWHEDATRDCWGTFCYLRDPTTGVFWSAAHQPTLERVKSYEAIFTPGRAEFRLSDGALEAYTEISVSPEDDIELRQVSLTNLGEVARTIELTSYAEVVLATAEADAAHPAFSNLFVETELVRTHQAILCTRRPRSATERPPWMFHLMRVHGPIVGATSYETARGDFIGRGRSPIDPIAMHHATLGDSEGAVLDPIVAIRNTVSVGVDETVRLHFVTGVAATREEALTLIEKYADHHLARRVFELAWTQGQVTQRRLEATSAETQIYDRLASHILYANPAMRAPSSVLARNRRGQAGLWAFGISGDLPIVLVRIVDIDKVDLVRQMLRAHAYWRLKGLTVDLVIWNEDPSGYRQNLHDLILGIIATLPDATIDRPGGIFLRRDQMSEEDSVLMQAVARVVVSDGAGTLAEQIERRPRAQLRPPPLVTRDGVAAPPPHERQATRPALARPDLQIFNGLGGFTGDGKEYVITTTRDVRTPAPWSNVIANPFFGTVVSESGGAYTWCENAHSYRLTPWRNDPVSDPSGEALYLRDEDNGRFWSPTPLPAPGPNPYVTRHGFGYSVFEYEESAIRSEVRTFVAGDAPIKFLQVRLVNGSDRRRRVSLSAYFELVLGTHRKDNAPHLVSEVDLKTGALFARNCYSAEFAHRHTFLDCSERVRTVSGDRATFIGRNGSLAHPQAMRNAHLMGRVGAGLDPCLAMQTVVELAPGQEHEVVFMFGSGRDLEDARTLVTRFRGRAASLQAMESVWAFWGGVLGTVHVTTPDPTLDFLANGWLVYQVLSCRMWARSGYYQSGGAYGFRDQLQDAAALVHAAPSVLREHILRAAAHQFPEGDVQHWWHPPLGRGVRTRISDDYLWLPSVVCRYVAATGDTGVLDERVEFIEGRPVRADEDSYYDLPNRSGVAGTLYDHCARAVAHGLGFGEHGLPLMGTGDWNDGMNLVGDEGRGESVWLGFFLFEVLGRFGELARQRGDVAFAERCASEARRLGDNLEAHAWDGEWYRRAWFDDGRPLGSKESPECRIDSLPQSWAVLSGVDGGVSGRARALQGLASLDKYLVDREVGVVKLFDPPFDRSDLEPGYVKGYVPGVRENGGQYTHAAVWAVMAFAAVGDSQRAWDLFGIINPIRHGDSAAGVQRYRVEPYVVAADVYTNPRHAGRGGWTWYTGSAGWMYRLIVESLLGLKLEVDHLRIAPVVPATWPSFDVHYRWRDTMHHIHVVNPSAAPNATGRLRVVRVVADGAERGDHTIPLASDRAEHWAEVTLGPADLTPTLAAGGS